MRSTPGKGFTLVELIVVLAVLVLASTVMIPAFVKFHHRQQLTLAARRTIALALEARGLAVTRDTGVSLIYDRQAHGLRLVMDPPDPDAGREFDPAGAPVGSLRTGDLRLLEYPLEVQIRIERPDPGQPAELRFRPDGRAGEAIVAFTRDEFEPLLVALNPRTGRMRVMP